jgi:excisionase family DNA binding protein
MNDIKSINQNEAVNQPRTYRVEEIAEILEIGRTSAYNLIKEEKFKVVRIGNAIRISRKSFDAWLDGQFGEL